ncbi:TPA: hypothetical protein GF146_23875 [Escherichia coli]|nr:hypothetical protein [Escherichia coli]
MFPVRPPASPADTVASVLIVCFSSSLRSDCFTPGYNIPAIALATNSPVAALARALFSCTTASVAFTTA